MELYRKMLSKPGLWQTDAGSINITRDRNKRFAAKGNAMLAMGLNPVVPYGHKLAAVPQFRPDMEADELQAVAEQLEETYAKWNSGYVEKFEYDDRNGCLYYHAPVPPGLKLNTETGCLENEQDKTVIKEVSPGIGNWIDGYGNEHKDVIIHAALCTHPVQPGMTGFERSQFSAQTSNVLSLSRAGKIRPTFYFLGGSAVASEDDDKKKKKPPMNDDGETEPVTDPDADGDDDANPFTDPDADASEAEVAPVATPAADPAAAGTGVGGAMTPQLLDQFKQIFQMLGQPLLGDTNPGNGLERMLVALHTAANHGATLQPKGQDSGGGGDLDLSMKDANPDQNSQMGAYGNAPVFMSSVTGKIQVLDQSGLTLAKAAAKGEADTICGLWDKLAVGGSAELRALVANEKAKVATYRLSHNPNTNKVNILGARKRLADFKKILVASGAWEFKKKLSKAIPETLPTDGVNNPAPNAPTNSDALKAEIASRMSKHLGAKVDPATITILNRKS